jgi:hypothetical protein
VQRAGLADELKEGGLEGVVRRMRVDEDAPTDPEDGWAMPADDALERPRVAGVEIAAEQLGIVLSRGRDVHQLVHHSGQREIRHEGFASSNSSAVSAG